MRGANLYSTWGLKLPTPFHHILSLTRLALNPALLTILLIPIRTKKWIITRAGVSPSNGQGEAVDRDEVGYTVSVRLVLI